MNVLNYFYGNQWQREFGRRSILELWVTSWDLRLGCVSI